MGANYLQVLVRETSAPFQIEFQPKLSAHDEDEDGVIEGTEVRVRLLGTISFRYGEDIDNRDNLRIMNDLFVAIEREYSLVPKYANFHLVSTPKDFDETWQVRIKKSFNGAEVSIGRQTMNVDAKDISPLYDAFKKYITLV
jgi:hypothetical protein